MLKGRGLEGTAVGEGELPGVGADLVHSIKVHRGLFLGLAARQEHNAGKGGGHSAGEGSNSEESDLLGAGLGALGTGGDHVGLEEGTLKEHLLVVQLLEYSRKHLLSHIGAVLDVMSTVSKDLGLYNGDQPVLLADGGVAGKAIRNLSNGLVGRLALSLIDLKNRPPLGEARTSLVVLAAALTETVKTHGGLLPVSAGNVLKALVDLDAGDDVLLFQELNHGNTLGGLLVESLLEQDGAAAVLAKTLGGEEEASVEGAVLFSVLDVDRSEALGNRT